TLLIGSRAVHVTSGSPPVFRLTVSVLPDALAVNVAFGPRCTIGSLIDSRAITSAVTPFSQRGTPVAVPLATGRGRQTRSRLTRYGVSTPEKPPNVSAAAVPASPETRARVSGKAVRITIST